MQPDSSHSELLFSYGTLQLEAVQTALFRRLLKGSIDALPGFVLVSLKIDDPLVVAISGKEFHTMASFTGRSADAVPGTVFALTPEELKNADGYEVPALKRVSAVLQSGLRAWVYIDARSTPVQS
ncbi:MAG: gamma-glutamylcyclotransferase family protein [Acidobacteriota bacterium]